ncbi:hypothetical protein GCM10009562_14180 [Nocardioides aquaticus]
MQDRRVDLNARYEEQIDITGYPDGSGGRDYRIVIDGTTRDDCSEDDGVLNCVDDPRPTEQLRSAGRERPRSRAAAAARMRPAGPVRRSSLSRSGCGRARRRRRRRWPARRPRSR